MFSFALVRLCLFILAFGTVSNTKLKIAGKGSCITHSAQRTMMRRWGHTQHFIGDSCVICLHSARLNAQIKLFALNRSMFSREQHFFNHHFGGSALAGRSWCLLSWLFIFRLIFLLSKCMSSNGFRAFGYGFMASLVHQQYSSLSCFELVGSAQINVIAARKNMLTSVWSMTITFTKCGIVPKRKAKL